MISDILSDAAASICDYLRALPDTYREPTILSQIDAVLSSMDALPDRLDAPPVLEGCECGSCRQGRGARS